VGISYRFIDPTSRAQKNSNIFAHTKEALHLFIHNRKLRLLSLASMISFATGELRYQFKAAFFATVWPLWAIGISSLVSNFGASLSYYFSHKILARFKAINMLLLGTVYGKVVNLIAYIFPTIFSPVLYSSSSIFYGVGQVVENTLMQQEFNDHQRATMSSLNSLGGCDTEHRARQTSRPYGSG
jgi:Na+/melibiose symporter-like transporter